MAEEVKISTDINENVNINGTVNIAGENGANTQIMYMNCSLNADTFGANVNVSVNDKKLYKDNAETIKVEYNKFKDLVNERATALGYVAI
ncbi:MAG: hypothetical protein RR942_14555 [Romboutsia sp.]